MMLRAIVVLCLISSTLGFSLKRAFGPDGRIVGGKPTSIIYYPYQVSVQLMGQHWCGGSIISPYYILTAAHCFGYLPLEYDVRVSSSFPETGGVVHEITQFIIHQTYGTIPSNSHDYDIALLRLSTPITFSETAQPVALASRGEEVAVGTPAVVTGWGDLKEGGYSASVLQEVHVPVITNADCAKSYSGITDRMICAGFQSGGRDACQGDSGGPLVANDKLIGIVSFGRGCARPDYPGVYARVGNLRDWISQNSGI